MSFKLDIFGDIATKKRYNSSDDLAEKLKNMIITGKLPSGYVFPNENILCQQLLVGRGTLREAYKVLDTLGYISRGKNGTIVNDKKSIAENGSFIATLEFSKYDELIESILLIEPQLVGLAAKKATTENLKQIFLDKQKCEESKNNLALLEVYNHSFHQKIRSAAHNNLMTSAVIALYEAFERHVVSYVYGNENNVGDFIKNCINQHQELYQALLEHDVEKAQAISYDHLKADIDRIMTLSR